MLAACSNGTFSYTVTTAELCKHASMQAFTDTTRPFTRLCTCIFRALRLLRLSLLIGNVPQMRLSKGALLASAVNVPLMWLLASVVSWLFTAASLVSDSLGGPHCYIKWLRGGGIGNR